MVLLILGSTTCPICSQVIRQDEDFYGFPAFSANSRDPLHRFSDAAFHEACLMADPAGRKAAALVEYFATRTGPGNRKCEVCGEEILDYNDHGMISYICLPGTHPIAEFNYVHFHLSHVNDWHRKTEFTTKLKEAAGAGLVSEEDARRILRYIGLGQTVARRDSHDP